MSLADERNLAGVYVQGVSQDTVLEA
jgi:hypothetical protein